MKKLILFSLFTLSIFSASTQVIGFDRVDEKTVKPWFEKDLSAYESIYHFGDSEGESGLLIMVNGDQVNVQLRSHVWSNEGSTWLGTYENFTNVQIEENCFYSDQTKGNFVQFTHGGTTQKGLKVTSPWGGFAEAGEYEIGPVSAAVPHYFEGKYPEASYRLLKESQVSKMTKSDLQIMRNEIFARYGYIFRKGGKMETYFQKQTWYREAYKDVDAFLSQVEKKNIQLIQAWEKKK